MTENAWLPILYRDFHDIPRLIAVERGGETYLLDCPFDATKDDYSDWFTVYRLPQEAKPLLAQDSWISLTRLGEPVGRIHVSNLELDSSRRRLLNDRVFEGLEPI